MIIFNIEGGNEITVNSISMRLAGGISGLNDELAMMLSFTAGRTGHGAIYRDGADWSGFPEDVESGLGQLGIPFTIDGNYDGTRTKINPDLIY